GTPFQNRRESSSYFLCTCRAFDQAGLPLDRVRADLSPIGHGPGIRMDSVRPIEHCRLCAGEQKSQ
ncbi:MAG: hypothetical protein KAY46_17305, partial [Burkholderiaceae bacterium]|nr:hypothetical protein [Burkholderiaceae bacterium]